KEVIIDDPADEPEEHDADHCPHGAEVDIELKQIVDAHAGLLRKEATRETGNEAAPAECQWFFRPEEPWDHGDEYVVDDSRSQRVGLDGRGMDDGIGQEV